MARVGGYAGLEKRASHINRGMKELMDKFIAALDKKEGEARIHEELAEIENKLLSISGAEIPEDELEINERIVLLEKIISDHAAVHEKIPGAIGIENHEELAAQFEKIASEMHFIRQEISKLRDGGGSAVLERKILLNAKKRITLAEKMLSQLEKSLSRKPSKHRHPLHKKSVSIGRKIRHLHTKHRKAAHENIRKKLARRAMLLREEMRLFLQRQLEGRVFVDSREVLIRSGLTGSEKKWKIDDSLMYALDEMFFNTTLSGISARLKNGKSQLVGKFECKPHGNGLVVEMEVGERTIAGDNIIFKPHKVRIEP